MALCPRSAPARGDPIRDLRGVRRLVLEADDRQHRTEHFLLGDAHVVADVREDGRLDELPAGDSGPLGRLAAKDAARALAPGAIEQQLIESLEASAGG